MPEKKEKTEGTGTRRIIKLPPAIGDWTTIRPSKIPSRRVKLPLYGFDRLSSDELSQAHFLHYNFFNSFIKSIKTTLELGGELYTVSAEQVSYGDFIKMVTQPVVHSKLTIPNFPGTIILCIDLPLANTLINHALGSRDLTPINRSLTEMEEEILTSVITEHLSTFPSVFGEIFEVPKFTIVSSPNFSIDPTINSVSTFVFVSAEITFGDNPPYKIIIGYLGKTLKYILETYQRRAYLKPLNIAKLPTSILDKTYVQIVTNLGGTAIATQDIQALEPGDVISLDESLHAPVPITLGRHVKLLGQPGTKGAKTAVKILSLSRGRREIPAEIPKPEMAEIKEKIKEELPLEKIPEEEYTPFEEEEFLPEEEK